MGVEPNKFGAAGVEAPKGAGAGEPNKPPTGAGAPNRPPPVGATSCCIRARLWDSSVNKCR